MTDALGVTIVDLPPIGIARLELRGGVTALYGVNGAGKTRLLEGLRSALTGRRPSQGRVYLHLRVADDVYLDDEANISPEWVAKLHLAQVASLVSVRGRTLASLTGQRDRMTAIDDLDSAQDLSDAVADFAAAVGAEDFSPSTPNEVVLAHVSALLASEPADAVREFYEKFRAARRQEDPEGGLYVLEPVGESGARWRVYAAATMKAASDFRQMVAADVEEGARLAAALDSARSNLDAKDYDELQTLTDSLLPSSGAPWTSIDALSPNDVVMFANGNLTNWPDWASMPVVATGELDSGPFTVIDAMDETVYKELDAATMALLQRAAGGRLISGLDESDVVYAAEATELLSQIEALSHRVIAGFLEPAPRPRFDLGEPNQWAAGDLPHWIALARNTEIELGALSWAERRWTVIGITLAVASVGQKASVLLCDEPERGLHRRAERDLPRGLHQAAIEARSTIFAATHSPALLNDARVQKLHVTRTSNGSRTHALPWHDAMHSRIARDLWMTELGLNPADLFQMTRVFVCVEGIHDRILFQHLLADDLDAGRGVCLNIGGAKVLPSVLDAEVLFQFSDAPIVIVLDNLLQQVIQPIWQRIQDECGRGAAGQKQLDQALRDLERVGGGEAKWLRSLAGNAVESGHLHRLSVFGLQQTDVICYLPAGDFVNGANEWTSLLSSWRSEAGANATDFKGWLKKPPRGARISARTIGRSVDGMRRRGQPIDPDLVKLGLFIREQAAR